MRCPIPNSVPGILFQNLLLLHESGISAESVCLMLSEMDTCDTAEQEDKVTLGKISFYKEGFINILSG